MPIDGAADRPGLAAERSACSLQRRDGAPSQLAPDANGDGQVRGGGESDRVPDSGGRARQSTGEHPDALPAARRAGCGDTSCGHDQVGGRREHATPVAGEEPGHDSRKDAEPSEERDEDHELAEADGNEDAGEEERESAHADHSAPEAPHCS
jgi:hypothetical protein